MMWSRRLVLCVALLCGCSACESRPQIKPLVDLRPAVDLPLPSRDWSITDIDLSRCTAPRPVAPRQYATPLGATPAIKWKCHLAKGEPLLTAPMAIGPELVITSMWGGIQAVSLEGALLWSLPAPPADPKWFVNFRAMGNGDRIFFGDGALQPVYGRVHALSLNGQEKWQRSLDGPFSDKLQPVNGPFLAGDGSVVVGGGDKTLYALDSASGAITRRTALPGVARDVVIDSAGTMYVALFDSSLVVAMSATGKLLWSHLLEAAKTNAILGLALSPTGDLIAAVSANDTARFKDAKLKVLAIDPGCGRPRWSMTVTGLRLVGGPVVGIDGAVFLALMFDGDGIDSLLSLSPQGETLWRKELPTALGRSDTLARFAALGPLGADGTLHALAYGRGASEADPRVVAFSQKGDTLWDLPVPDVVFDLSGSRSQPVLLKDGTLVFGGQIRQSQTSDIFLYAIQTRSPGLAPSTWPRVYHDNQSTSNAATPLD